MEGTDAMSVIMLPTWDLDGLTLNTSDPDGVEWIVEQDEGWDSAPAPRLSMMDRVTGHGSYDNDAFLEPRTIVLNGYLIAPTRTAADGAVRRLAAVGTSGARSVLTVTEPDRTLTSQVRLARRTEVSRRSSTCVAFQLSLIAADPRKYATDLHQLTTGAASPAPGGVLWGGPAGTTGIQWNGPAETTGVVWQSGSGATGILSLINAGSMPAPLEFVITDYAGDITDPTITDLSTGRVISYRGIVPAGASLVIDTETGSVLLNGSNRGPLLSRDEWFSIPAYSQIEIEFSATNSSSASLLARWRDTYI